MQLDGRTKTQWAVEAWFERGTEQSGRQHDFTPFTRGDCVREKKTVHRSLRVGLVGRFFKRPGDTNRDCRPVCCRRRFEVTVETRDDPVHEPEAESVAVDEWRFGV